MRAKKENASIKLKSKNTAGNNPGVCVFIETFEIFTCICAG